MYQNKINLTPDDILEKEFKIDTRGYRLKEVDQFLDLIIEDYQTFIEMIKREITDDSELEKLEEAIAFKNVSNMPARVKCALLAWHTLEDMINKGETDGKISSSCCH